MTQRRPRLQGVPRPRADSALGHRHHRAPLRLRRPRRRAPAPQPRAHEVPEPPPPPLLPGRPARSLPAPSLRHPTTPSQPPSLNAGRWTGRAAAARGSTRSGRRATGAYFCSTRRSRRPPLLPTLLPARDRDPRPGPHARPAPARPAACVRTGVQRSVAVTLPSGAARDDWRRREEGGMVEGDGMD